MTFQDATDTVREASQKRECVVHRTPLTIIKSVRTDFSDHTLEYTAHLSIEVYCRTCRLFGIGPQVDQQQRIEYNGSIFGGDPIQLAMWIEEYLREMIQKAIAQFNVTTLEIVESGKDPDA